MKVILMALAVGICPVLVLALAVGSCRPRLTTGGYGTGFKDGLAWRQRDPDYRQKLPLFCLDNRAEYDPQACHALISQMEGQ